MPQYMLLIYGDESQAPAAGTPEADAMHGAWMAITEKLRASGQMLAGDALESPTTATTVRVRDGERVVTDGPFAETREMLGGYYLLDAPDLDTAIDWAGQLPAAPHGSIEVRPVMTFPA